MVEITDWINDITNLNMTPETILFIFLGIAVLSLICLCTILFIGLKANKEEDIPLAQEANIEKANNTLMQKAVEEVFTKNEEIKVDDNLTNNIIKLEEEIPKIKEEVETDIPFTKNEIESIIKEQNINNETSSDLDLTNIEEEKINSLQEAIIEDNPISLIEEPTKQALPQIFSSVYLEPREELMPSPDEISSIDEPQFRGEEITPALENDLIKNEEVENNIRRENIFENIFENNIEDEGFNAFDNNLQMKRPGKIYEPEQTPSYIEPEIDSLDNPKEVILTADMLRERLANLQNIETNDNKKTTDETEELDKILKQVGLNNYESPELDNEEEIILGR